MKKILVSLDDVTISMMEECIKKLNETPEEGKGWNKSRFIRVAIYKSWKKIIPPTKKE